MSDERSEELETLSAIYPELITDTSNHDAFSAQIEIPVAPTEPLLVRFIPSTNSGQVMKKDSRRDSVPSVRKAFVERDVHLSHLPPITLFAKLTPNYPTSDPPEVRLESRLGWLSKDLIVELEQEAAKLWEDSGRCQILFAYIDHVQQAAERGFDICSSADGCLVLSSSFESDLVGYDAQKKQELFEAGTYDCGVCLDRKKGSMCYQMKRCGHIFCRQCLQDFYNNAIGEGDVGGVKCMDPDCGSKKTDTLVRRRKRKQPLITPGELLDMGMGDAVVRRFVEMKRKKKMEADKSTVYCPRTWCQGAAKSSKYPPVPADLRSCAPDEPLSDDETNTGNNVAADGQSKTSESRIPPNPADRLVVCEKCSFAFCQVCYMGWHGPFARCYPRDPNELSAEEKASYEFIRKHTSPCAYCNVPVQKTMGCNHMQCFQCATHFCYLCGAWLDPGNPYQHFNKEGTPCYQRLWELEEGDNAQAPRDGQGFAGPRAWEQMAIDAAREADEAEDAAIAARAQEDEDREIARILPDVPQPPDQGIPLAVAMAQVQLVRDAPPPNDEPQRNGRRRRNPFPAQPPANGNAQAVRNHERGARRRPGLAQERNAEDDRHQAELQRFLEMAQRDEEDGWNSDELGGDDEDFVIR